MDKENLSDDQRKNIDSILKQLKNALTLPPSKSFLMATENALDVFAKRNFWHVLITVESIFFNLMEFSKKPGVVNDYKEMRRSQLFAQTFLRNYKRQYHMFSENFIRERDNYTKHSPPSSSPVLEINSGARALFIEAANLAVEVFGSKYMQGEHLILSFFSPRLPALHQFFRQHGVIKEELLVEWVASMNLSIKELRQWQQAFDFIKCETHVAKIIEEREAQKAKPKEKESPAKEKQPAKINQNPEIPIGELGRTPSRDDKPAGKIDDDLLGREDLVKALAEMVADEKQGTPFTIGLLGHWGSGKSTVMKMLQDVLSSRDDSHRFEFAEFNAWEYERTDNLEAGLAQEVVSSLIEPLGKKEKWRVRLEFALREHGPKVKRSMIFAGLILVGIVVEVIWLGTNLDDKNNSGLWINTLFGGGLAYGSIKFWNHFKKLYDHPLSVELRTYLKLPNYGEHLGLIPVLKRHIQTLCQIRLGTALERKEQNKLLLGKWNRFFIEKDTGTESKLSRRLVVFIDDLDRCNPKSITKILDAVRLVMDTPNVIVIIGIDHRIALRAVGKSYENLADSKRSSDNIARDYLGKILQLVIVLNRPHAGELKSYVHNHLFPTAKTSGRSGEEKAKEETQTETVTANKKPIDNTVEKGSKVRETSNTLEDKEKFGNFPGLKLHEEKQNWSNKEIEYSMEERDLFAELAEAFELANPRQLLRLHNSYGLLKLLYGMRNVLPVKPGEQESDDDKTKLMILLFWKEFDCNHPKWAIQVKASWAGTLDTSENQVEPMVLKIAKQTSRYDVTRMEFTVTGALDIGPFVERFVLPRGDVLKSSVEDKAQK